METIAPRELAAQWDNVGLMAGDPEQEVSSILVALDPSEEVIRHALKTGSDLVLTHHPLFFHPIRSLDLSEPTARKAALLLQHGIALVSLHTNLDAAPGGVADQLAARLGLADIERRGMLRIGRVTPTPLEAWVTSLAFPGTRICAAGRSVSLVAACPGSGMDLWREACDAGCDTLVTGDVRYHGAIAAREAGLNVVDLGHFASEALIVQPLAERLRRLLPGIEQHAYAGTDIFKTLER